jgi:hypothetical protein
MLWPPRIEQARNDQRKSLRPGKIEGFSNFLLERSTPLDFSSDGMQQQEAPRHDKEKDKQPWHPYLTPFLL